MTTASASSTTTPAPNPSATPAPEPAATPTYAAGVVLHYLPPGSDARVEVDLRLREEPGTDAPIVAMLQPGTVLHLVGPPWQRDTGDGYAWRRVTVGSDPADWRVGWVATLGGTGFVMPEPIECPSGVVDLQSVINLTEWERLSCLTGQELVLEGEVITGFGGYMVGTFEPGWLAGPFGFSGAIAAAEGYLMYHQPPGSEPVSAADGTRLRVTGHFDDPAAKTCRIATGEPAVPEPDDLAIAYCRERFVATSIEIIGP